MAKLVRTLTTKINKLDFEKNSNRPTQGGERNPNQFRHPFAPRFIPTERRNNDIRGKEEKMKIREFLLRSKTM